MDTPWDEARPAIGTLGQVCSAAFIESSYFKNGLSGPWKPGFRQWLRQMRKHPEAGCDGAFLFAAAARYGVRIHAYTCCHQKMRRDVFAAPPMANAPSILRPTCDIHLGVVEGDSLNTGHCVSLPVATNRMAVLWGGVGAALAVAPVFSAHL